MNSFDNISRQIAEVRIQIAELENDQIRRDQIFAALLIATFAGSWVTALITWWYA